MKPFIEFILLIVLVRIRSGKNLNDLRLSGTKEEIAECIFIGCSCSNGSEEEDKIYSIYQTKSFSKTSKTSSNENDHYDYDLKSSQLYDVICRAEANNSKNEFAKLNEFPHRRLKNEIKKIGTLDISTNKINYIPGDRLVDLDIDVADFSQNSITGISNDAFRGIYKLENLDLSRNELKNINENIFEPIKLSLKNLVLSSNELGEMQVEDLTQVLSQFIYLKTLILNHNNINQLPNLSKLAHLQEIGLSNNLIETLNNHTQDNQVVRLLPNSLISLICENNHLKTINDNTFSNLINLKYLNLASNQISSISSNAFSHLTQLVQLNLAKNYIKHIPSKLFYKLSHLERIDFSDQNYMLNTLEDYLFERETNLNPIRKVDLSKNHILNLTKKLFCTSRSIDNNGTNAFAHIVDLDLSHNPLNNLFNACLWRQLFLGFNSSYKPQQLLPKVSIKTFHYSEKKMSVMKCDCEVTKSSYFVELEGECENQAGVPVFLNQFKCTKTDDYSSIDETEEKCKLSMEYDCTNAVPKDIASTKSAFNKNLLNYETTTPVQRFLIDEIPLNKTEDDLINSAQSLSYFIKNLVLILIIFITLS